MTAQGLTTKLASAFLIFAIFIATAKAQNAAAPNHLLQPNGTVWNVTTSVEDYIIQNQLQYAANIVNYERQIDAYITNFYGQAETLAIQSNLIENKLQEANEKLYPLESLSLLTKHCVQSYRWKLPDSATIKTRINSCISTARSSLSSYTTPLVNTKNTLYNYYNNQLKTGLNDCQKKNTASQYNYTVCVTQVINTANVYTINNRKTFTTQLQTADCNGVARIIVAGECGFNQIYSTSNTIGETLSLIDTCIDGFLTSAGGSHNTTSIGGFANICPNVLNLQLKEVDFRNATINNPFYGFSSPTRCLQVNFV